MSTTVMSSESIKELGRIVRTLRKLRGWTQGRLAKEAGLSRDAIIKLEGGEREPRSRTVEKVAEALEVDIYTLSGLRTVEGAPSGVETPSEDVPRPEPRQLFRPGRRAPSEGPGSLLGYLTAVHMEARERAREEGRTEEEILSEAEREYTRRYGSIFASTALPTGESLERSRGVSLGELGLPPEEAQDFPPGGGLADEIVAERGSRS